MYSLLHYHCKCLGSHVTSYDPVQGVGRGHLILLRLMLKEGGLVLRLEVTTCMSF